MVVAKKKIDVRKDEDGFTVDYGDIRFESKRVYGNNYDIDVYDLLERNNARVRGSRITEYSLEVVLDSDESRFMDFWHVLEGYYGIVSSKDCLELDSIFIDILGGKYDRPVKEDRSSIDAFFPGGRNPHQDYIDRQKKDFCNLWKKRFRDNK